MITISGHFCTRNGMVQAAGMPVDITFEHGRSVLQGLEPDAPPGSSSWYRGGPSPDRCRDGTTCLWF